MPKTYVTQTYVSGKNGYRIWSDGYKEQWGYATANNVTFSKEFSNTNYNLTFGTYRNGTVTSGEYRHVKSWSTIGFVRELDSNESIWWEAKGY